MEKSKVVESLTNEDWYHHNVKSKRRFELRSGVVLEHEKDNIFIISGAVSEDPEKHNPRVYFHEDSFEVGHFDYVDFEVTMNITSKWEEKKLKSYILDRILENEDIDDIFYEMVENGIKVEINDDITLEFVENTDIDGDGEYQLVYKHLQSGLHMYWWISYNSYDGTTYDSPRNFEFCEPYQVSVTKYRSKTYQ